MSRPVNVPQFNNELLYCSKCNQYLSIDSFSTNPQRLDRNKKHSYCKDCCSRAAKLRRNNLHKDSLDKLLKERLNSLKSRSKNNGWYTNITLDYLKNLLKKQNFKCAISGIQMTHCTGSKRVFTNISVDRINSKIGYIEGNIQLVCMAVNQMKSDLSLEELYQFCEHILKYKNNES